MATLDINTTVGGRLLPLFVQHYADIMAKHSDQLVEGRFIIVAQDESRHNKNRMAIYQFIHNDIVFFSDNDIDVSDFGITLDKDLYPDETEVRYDTMGNVSKIIDKYKDELGNTVTTLESNLEYSNGLLYKATTQMKKGTLEVIYTYQGSDLIKTTSTYTQNNS